LPSEPSRARIRGGAWAAVPKIVGFIQASQAANKSNAHDGAHVTAQFDTVVVGIRVARLRAFIFAVGIRNSMKRRSQTEIETHGSKQYPTSTLLASSKGLGWSAISADLRSHVPGETQVMPREHVQLCFAVTGNENCLVTRTGAGQHQETIPLTGTAWLSPPGIGDSVLSISAPIPKGMHVYLPAMLFSRLAENFDLPKDPANSVRYVAGIRDSVINSIVLSILSEMMAKSSVGAMYVETASLMLAAHIIRAYCDNGAPRLPAPGPSELDRVRILPVLDFISAHLADKITLSELAKVAGLSTFHFAHMFTHALGVSPHRYVSRLRLENAMKEITAGKSPLSQIALNAGFTSQASFTRAFSRATGVTPGEYRRNRS
jgi:AraC family transcriptional regulator